jgi:hypothetical protein
MDALGAPISRAFLAPPPRPRQVGRCQLPGVFPWSRALEIRARNFVLACLLPAASKFDCPRKSPARPLPMSLVTSDPRGLPGQ